MSRSVSKDRTNLPSECVSDSSPAVITVRLLLFAKARELADGVANVSLDSPPVVQGDALKVLVVQTVPQLRQLCGRFVLAVDNEYVADEQTVELHPHSEVAVIPPLSGG